MVLRLCHHSPDVLGRQGARGFITAFARNLVVTLSAPLNLSAYMCGLARRCPFWVFTEFTLFYIAFLVL